VQSARLLLPQWIGGNSRTFRLKYVSGLRDGHRTGYDIRQGQYWVPIDGDWCPVPPEAVIKTENPVGEAIVWYLWQSPDSGLPHSELYKIICFVPSGDV
jgi:hypothetical protein